MKKNLFLVSAITMATLASCTQESMLDPTIVSASSAQVPIDFSTYASSTATTRGTAVTSNSDFQSVHGEFEVTALVSDAEFEQYYDTDEEGLDYGTYDSFSVVDIATGYAAKYFNFSNVKYSDGSWSNTNKMYWPNDSRVLYFAAYSPTSANISTRTDSEGSGYTFSAYTNSSDNQAYKFIFPYTVSDDIDEQVDLMYAMTRCDYLSPADRERLAADGATYSYITDGTDYTNTEESVNLHFKHALTQIAFTATKDDDIEVYVHSITICNVYNSGTFTATALTDDEDTSVDVLDNDNATVGDSGDSGDKVNAKNFGTWVSDFSGDWASLTTSSSSSPYYYYTDGGHSSMSNYEATLVDLNVNSPTGLASVQLGDDVTALTSSTKVLMLMPQKLTPWVPTSSTVINYVGYTGTDGDTSNLTTTLKDEDSNAAVSTADNSLSYLAIDCEIYHRDITDDDAVIHDGYIFVPFETKDIAYKTADVDNSVSNADEWLAGYKITYCLDFGGGYVVEEGHGDIIPDPGCIPDTETYTLRTITYTTSVDTWIDVNEDIDLEDFENGVDTDTSYTPVDL